MTARVGKQIRPAAVISDVHRFAWVMFIEGARSKQTRRIFCWLNIQVPVILKFYQGLDEICSELVVKTRSSCAKWTRNILPGYLSPLMAVDRKGDKRIIVSVAHSIVDNRKLLILTSDQNDSARKLRFLIRGGQNQRI
jgi:hypothetical protein